MDAVRSEAADYLKWPYKYISLISISSYLTPCSLGLSAKRNEYFALTICKVNVLNFQDQITIYIYYLLCLLSHVLILLYEVILFFTVKHKFLQQ